MFSGLPQGWTEQRNPIGGFGAPNFIGPGGPMQGPQWSGGSIFGGTLGGTGMPGSLAGPGSYNVGNLGGGGPVQLNGMAGRNNYMTLNTSGGMGGEGWLTDAGMTPYDASTYAMMAKVRADKAAGMGPFAGMGGSGGQLPSLTGSRPQLGHRQNF